MFYLKNVSFWGSISNYSQIIVLICIYEFKKYSNKTLEADHKFASIFYCISESG